MLIRHAGGTLEVRAPHPTENSSIQRTVTREDGGALVVEGDALFNPSTLATTVRIHPPGGPDAVFAQLLTLTEAVKTADQLTVGGRVIPVLGLRRYKRTWKKAGVNVDLAFAGASGVAAGVGNTSNNRILLEDGSGALTLEDGSGYIIQEG